MTRNASTSDLNARAYSYFARLFAGDLSAFGGPATDDAIAGHIRAEQMSLVLGYSVGIMVANACNAGIAPLRTRCALSPACGEGWGKVFPQRDNPRADKALTRRCAPTSPQAGEARSPRLLP
ncbi:hypothetical protein JQ554_06005 [Bradyrhizobium diazoefficiens]|nr:hypothetical protein [Bradyrhizobium diazoefficiens]UCF55704.1 MAG: hypothetical protein JSV48_12575 [Bradyrhizobium sp.]MBR0963652.1 hypothetical protein [Bradyrhizobium diazoefficiens]MBR0977804.1 hypothetical protein [Bradyrhizobium diazoefficiens]MBR1007314.1 hypothetical protein [Bradyrhizobium diazoefficiens]MBR1012845.1 hypothetical protein [Bradyrhizobium diazoefficiens]